MSHCGLVLIVATLLLLPGLPTVVEGVQECGSSGFDQMVQARHKSFF